MEKEQREERNVIEVELVQERLTLVTILAKNGYTVKIVTKTVVENGKNKKKTFVEYWRD